MDQPHQHRCKVLGETLLDPILGEKPKAVTVTVDVPHISLGYRRLYVGALGENERGSTLTPLRMCLVCRRMM